MGDNLGGVGHACPFGALFGRGIWIGWDVEMCDAGFVLWSLVIDFLEHSFDSFGFADALYDDGFFGFTVKLEGYYLFDLFVFSSFDAVLNFDFYLLLGVS